MPSVWIILGMMAVTYVPRLLPGLLIGRYRTPRWFKAWLENIPYAALGALILPGLLKGENADVGAIGGVVAVLLSLLHLNIVLVMLGTVLTAIAVQYWL